jgi:hypothetical protein
MEGRRFGATQEASSRCFLHGVRRRSLGVFLLAMASPGCVLGFGVHVPIAPCALPLFNFYSTHPRLAVEIHSFRGVLRRLFFHRMVHTAIQQVETCRAGLLGPGNAVTGEVPVRVSVATPTTGPPVYPKNLVAFDF